MSFCKYSSEFLIETSTSIDNAFFNDYLPFAPDACVKVYLYGLYMCTQSAKEANSLEHFSKILNMPVEDIESAFYYWQQEGLVQILEKEPFEVAYLPVKENLGKLKKFDDKKYGSFNIELQELIVGRMITPTEYKEYYELMESYHIEPAAVLMVVRYATSLKGGSVGYKYITTIIKNWAYEGILTTQAVEEKLIELERSSGDLLEVSKSLGLKRTVTFEERSMFLKWKIDFGFLLEDIIKVAKTLKRSGGFYALNNLLTKYYELQLLDYNAIENYENEKTSLIQLAREIAKTIGVYYENLSYVVESYIIDWLSKGFSNDALLLTAKYCFKKNIRNLNGMDIVVQKFYKIGITSIDAINQYIEELVQIDKQIKEILETCGIIRNIISTDRSFYNTWRHSWHLSAKLIKYAAELSVGKTNQINYMNAVLASWKAQGITSVDRAKELQISIPNTEYEKKTDFITRSYSNDELNALFDNLDEVEI